MGAKGHDAQGLWEDRPGAISTYTRRKVDPLEMVSEDIEVLDIAHALAAQCRYNGHCFGHLSVARHSLWVADRVRATGGRTVDVLTGLLHDASEAYLGDLVKPLKHGPVLGPVFQEAEARVDHALARHFDLPWPWSPLVHEADQYVTVDMEIAALRWTWDSTPRADKEDWLAKFRVLTHALKVEKHG